jgi:hypothetical protein
MAEIVWFAVENPDVIDTDISYLGPPGMRTVYRRVLLIAPYAVLPSAAHSLTAREFFQNYDISARRVGNSWVPNTLADLRLRENRFAHQSTFPHLVDVSRINPFSGDTPDGSRVPHGGGRPRGRWG